MGNPIFESYRREVIGKAKGNVLEIGFGSGCNTPYYKNIDVLYALEPSKELFEISKRNLKATSFPINHIKSPAEKISSPNDSFDTVVSTWCLCSVSNPQQVLREIYRVLKPGGLFVFIDHGKSNNQIVAILQNALTPLSRALAGGCHLNRDIEKLLRSSNFSIDAVKKFTLKGRPTIYMYKGIAVATK